MISKWTWSKKLILFDFGGKMFSIKIVSMKNEKKASFKIEFITSFLGSILKHLLLTTLFNFFKFNIILL